jgi:N-formylglutamate deformylase
MDKKIILHIPHSSTIIPFSEGYLVDSIALENEILKLTDW